MAGILTVSAPGLRSAAGQATGPVSPGIAGGASVPATAPADIVDIKPLAVYGVDPALVRYALYALAAAVSIAAVMLAWRYWRRRRATATDVEAVRMSPEDLALSHLDILAVEAHQGKFFYFRISAIVREYLTGRYGIGAQEMTTEELLPCLHRLDLPADLSQRLRRFLRHSDGIKFAGERAEESRCRQDLDFARDFVRRTAPVLTSGTETVTAVAPAVDREGG